MKRMNSAAAQAMPKKSHNNANIAMPDYWQHLGLNKDPLGKSFSEDASYTPPKWEEYLDTLQDICRTKNALLSIIGVTGSGKTTLLKQFLAQIGSNMHICQIDAQADFDHTLLVETLASGFRLSIPDEDSAEEQLDAQLVEMQQHKKLCLLAIDNAHLLQSEMLQAICDLIAQQSPTQMRLHVLLVGEIPLHTRFDALDLPPEQVHVISLEGFSLEETDQYLQHRLAAAGHNGEILFSQAAVMRIYRLSSGIPGRVNRLAQRMLQNALAAPAEVPPLLSGKQVKFLGAGLLIALLAVIALGLTYINNRHRSSVPKALTDRPVIEKGLASPALVPTVTLATHNTVVALPNTTPAQTISVQQAEALMLKGTTAPAISAVDTPDKATTTDGNALSTVLLADDIKKSNELAIKEALAKPAEISKKGVDNSALPSKADNKGVESPTTTVVAADTTTPATSNVTVASKDAMADTLPVISDDDEVNVSAEDLPAASRIKPAPVEIAVTTPPANNHPIIPAKPATVLAAETPATKPALAKVQAPVTSAKTPTNEVSARPQAVAAAISHSDQTALLSAEQQGSLGHDEQYLLSLAPKNFSLQIIGSHQEATVKQFLAKSGLGKSAHIFHTQLQGADWYVLTYGQYPSAHAAQAAVATLPKLAKDLKPWPRRVADIQSAIKP
jgi:type II secretory pathway predicted ATPase ExeA/septal ring-binding cell division protein DamX